MACYPCTHCNKCGMYSAVGISVCVRCETPIPAGTPSCPNCGEKKTKVIFGGSSQKDPAKTEA